MGLSEPTQPTSAQDLIEEIAPRVSEVVAKLRTLAACVPVSPYKTTFLGEIDELAQCATILTLASATGARVDADDVHSRTKHDTREAVLRRVAAHRRHER